MENKNRLVDQFHKNSSELIEVNISEWKCQKYIDIRIWYLPNPAEPGSQTATKKGICISEEFLPKLIKSLEKAKKILEKGREKPEFGPERPQEGRSPKDEYADMGGEHPKRGDSPNTAEKQASQNDSKQCSQEGKG